MEDRIQMDWNGQIEYRQTDDGKLDYGQIEARQQKMDIYKPDNRRRTDRSHLIEDGQIDARQYLEEGHIEAR